jgi:hypothetical protein
MEPSGYDEIPLCKTLYFVRIYGTTGGIKQLGKYNRSEKGRGARVALSAHPTHTDTDTSTLN